MEAEPADIRGAASVRVLHPGSRLRLAAPADLMLEDGTNLAVDRQLPPDLPIGYHRLQPRGSGPPVRLIVAPPRCFLPGHLRAWGWAAQLYAARSTESWGIGDLADLRRLAEWSARDLGAGILLVNPLCAVAPLAPQQTSPYFPSSRRFRNPLYLRVEEAPGAGDDVAGLAAAGRALNKDRRLDRDKVFHLKMQALELLWARFGQSSRFTQYCAEQGEELNHFAAYCALTEYFRSGWRQWPAEFHDCGSAAVNRFAAAHADRIRFHKWLQWLLDMQLARSSAAVRIVHDLPIGVDPEGADAWIWRDLLAQDVTFGAPPDPYSASGQDWGLPPFIPHKLRASGYRPLIQTIRAALRHAGGLRIDHVMGLFRLWWIPRAAGATCGAYVRYAAEEQLAVLAVESHRARAFLIGEDLGTVESGVRERLNAAGLLSYRLLWFEQDRPAGFPAQALAAVTTHDLPTIAGLWTGADLDYQRQIGVQPNVEGLRRLRDRLQSLTGLPDDASVPEVIRRTHELMAQAPSMLLTASLEDALSVAERPNFPSTCEEWPNWSLALPKTLEEIESDPLPRAIAAALQRKSTEFGKRGQTHSP